MIFNYLLTALRSIKKYPLFSVINIFGLSVGLACSILILNYVNFELSYDQFHSKKDRIVRPGLVYGQDGSIVKTGVSPTALLPEFQREFPEIETGVRIFKTAGVVGRGDEKFQEPRFYFADGTFFDVFDFELLQGDPTTALTQPNSLVLAKSFVKKYFGDEDPIGKTLEIGASAREYKITGVVEDAPANSHFYFSMIASTSSLSTFKPENQQWGSANYATYLVLSPNTSLPLFQDKVSSFIQEQFKEDMEAGTFVDFQLKPLTDIHLYDDAEGLGLEANSDISYIYIFSMVGLMLLLIACINYMNLATARSADRAREVGIRKVMGAKGNQLVLQFIGEAFVITFFAMVIGLVLVFVFLPYFNQITGREIVINYLEQPGMLLTLAGFLVMVSLISGSYPAFVLSSFKAVKVLKGKFKSSGSGLLLRKVLVVFQFAVSMFLILGTIVVLNQMQYIQDQQLGYAKDQLVALPMDNLIRRNLGAFRTELTSSDQVNALTAASETVTEIQGGYSIWVEGKPENFDMNITAIGVARDFVKTTGLEILYGSDISEADLLAVDKENYEDRRYAFMLNETAVRNLGLEPEEAVGKKANLYGREGVIKAVMKDFHYTSLHEPIGSLAIFPTLTQLNKIMLNVKPGQPVELLSFLSEKWKELAPHRPFDYTFIDEEYASLYESEQRTTKAFSIFSMVAILIACLGLFGLATFTASQRAKEIGIRKVLGASVLGLVKQFSTGFVQLVLLAFALAAPIGYFLMDGWLQSFAYRVPVAWWHIALAGFVALFIAITTVSFQSVKAAMANPIDSLRDE